MLSEEEIKQLEKSKWMQHSTFVLLIEDLRMYKKALYIAAVHELDDQGTGQTQKDYLANMNFFIDLAQNNMRYPPFFDNEGKERMKAEFLSEDYLDEKS